MYKPNIDHDRRINFNLISRLFFFRFVLYIRIRFYYFSSSMINGHGFSYTWTQSAVVQVTNTATILKYRYMTSNVK